MAEFETSLPSVRQVQTYIKEKPQVEIKVVTGDVLTGQVFWQDPDCICLTNAEKVNTIIWRHSIVYLKLGSSLTKEG